MLTRALVAFVLLPMAACSDGGDTDTDTDVPADEVVVDRLYRFLKGRFDSEEQSRTNASYFHVQMNVCEASVPALGDRVLYLEQALASDLGSPYRQRLYVIEAGEEPDTAVSRIYTFGGEAGAVGACEDAAKLPTGAGAAEKVGCEVALSWDGSTFTGGTTGTDCPTSQGGDYATSEVTLDAFTLTSWDRGFNNDGSQAWGAVEGGYEFVRRTELDSAP